MEPHKMSAPPSSAAHAAVLQMVDDHTAHLEKLHTDRTELENHAAQNDWELS